MSVIKKKRLYEVSVMDGFWSPWTVLVAASSKKEAKRLGIDTLEKEFQVNRKKIEKTWVQPTKQFACVEICALIGSH
jgi:hypothetical protein